MEANYSYYNYISSLNRLDEILGQPAGSFDERPSLPSRDELTYANGYYANCSALFVDIRDSSKLPDSYTRPVLAKIYRAFISETVAVLKGHSRVLEINIVGDCVWGVFDTSQKSEIDELFAAACSVHSLIDVLRCKMRQRGYGTPIRAGIGIAYGRALMVKAGYKGSGLADVVYMGDVVNDASKLAAMASGPRTYLPIVLHQDVWHNLSDDYKAYTMPLTYSSAYGSKAVNGALDAWYGVNCT